jgi:hypothetical protein
MVAASAVCQLSVVVVWSMLSACGRMSGNVRCSGAAWALPVLLQHLVASAAGGVPRARRFIQHKGAGMFSRLASVLHTCYACSSALVIAVQGHRVLFGTRVLVCVCLSVNCAVAQAGHQFTVCMFAWE